MNSREGRWMYQIDGHIPDGNLKQLCHKVALSLPGAKQRLDEMARERCFKVTQSPEGAGVILIKITPKFGYSLALRDEKFSFLLQADEDIPFVLRKAKQFLSGELNALEADLEGEKVDKERKPASPSLYG
jgi:hypothetical protein